jgi:hypothetical protein
VVGVVEREAGGEDGGGERESSRRRMRGARVLTGAASGLVGHVATSWRGESAADVD